MTARPYPDPTSRFKILPQPLLSPAMCAVCGSPDREVVDFNKELDVNGYAYRVYICVLCLLDAHGQVQGYLESIGQDAGGPASDKQVGQYLRDNNLKVISNEHFDSLVFWASGSSAAVDAMLDDPLNAEVSEGQSGDDSENESESLADVDEPVADVRGDSERIPAFDL